MSPIRADFLIFTLTGNHMNGIPVGMLVEPSPFLATLSTALFLGAVDLLCLGPVHEPL